MTNLKSLYRQNYYPLKKALQSLGCNGFLFDDIYQEAFYIFMDKQKKLGGDIDFPHTFIRQVCMYLWYKEMRKRRRRRVELFGVAEDAVGYGGEERGGGGDQEGEGDSVWEGAEMAMLLLRCLEKMSAICRELLTLYSLGYSESRIGEVMNINSRESVKNRKYKCKSKLRTLIINDPLFDEIYR